MAWIQEKTKEEVEKIINNLFKENKIVSAGKIEEYIHHRKRKTFEPIYYWQCEVKINRE